MPLATALSDAEGPQQRQLQRAGGILKKLAVTQQKADLLAMALRIEPGDGLGLGPTCWRGDQL